MSENNKEKSYSIKIFKNSELIQCVFGIPSKNKAKELVEEFYTCNSGNLDGIIVQIN